MLKTNIIEIRKRKGITGPKLATMAGMNKGMLSLIERGIYHPTQAQVDAIEAALQEHIWLEEPGHKVPPR